MTDDVKPGELMPVYGKIKGRNKRLQAIEACEDRNAIAKLIESDLGISYLTALDYVDGIQNAVKQSPPVQSDAELQGAIAWMREKHKAGELPHGATWYLNKIIEAAEQRVAGQAEAIEALKEARKTLSSIGGYMLIGASDEATVCNRDHVIPALALLTAQKGV